MARRSSAPSFPELYSASDKATCPRPPVPSEDEDAAQAVKLQSSIKRLSAASSARVLLTPTMILSIFAKSELLESETAKEHDNWVDAAYKQELDWLMVGKATIQTYGVVLNILLDHTITLTNEMVYWDHVLSSYRCTSLYTIQTSPLRLWTWTNHIYGDTWQRFRAAHADREVQNVTRSLYVPRNWRLFYSLVRDSVRAYFVSNLQSKVFSSFTQSQLEAKSKRSRVRKLRDMSATGLGILMDLGMMFNTDGDETISSKSRSIIEDEWRNMISKSIALMETVLGNITVLELGASDLEEAMFQSLEDEAEALQLGMSHFQPVRLAARLRCILQNQIPEHFIKTTGLSRGYGRPSRRVRYWLPILALLLASSTLLHIFINRQAEIVSWIREFGSTTIDFWSDWVVAPTMKVIRTIRHDKGSEIAIMSKESLQGDRASLERMVVDFALDNANTSPGASLTDWEIADVRAKVKEGDLTLVLKAYEKDLRKPFIGTLRGDLIRALLIQIQKTKVDVEVAVGGIDNLLKSQELVFGFVGLTPGVLVCLGLLRWLDSAFTRQHSGIQSKKQRSIRVLRNIDRILISSTPTKNGVLSNRDHGMLLCEVHLLQKWAKESLPREVSHELLEETRDLLDLQIGADRQLHIVERIYWAYSTWLR